MSSFVAKDRLDELKYDFSPYGGSGVIEEPSTKRIEAFRSAIYKVTGEAAGVADGMENKELAERVKILAEADNLTREMDLALLTAVAEVCSDKPSVDELSVLPYRLQRAFIGWITGELLNPEG